MCRNCVKSKRECLGYDPVFRAQPTPSAIQPAPNPPPSLVVNPQDPASYSGAPPGYVPAASQPFAPSLQSESPAPSTEQLDQGSAVDPSLQSKPIPDMTSLQNAVSGSLQPQVTTATTGTTPTDSSTFKGMLSLRIALRTDVTTIANVLSSETSSDNRPRLPKRHSPSPSSSYYPNPTGPARRNTGGLSRYLCSCHRQVS